MKRFYALLSVLFVCGFLYYGFYSMMPSSGTPASLPETEFATERALVPLKEISKEPHFTTSEALSEVRTYIMGQLRALGLQPTTQEGFLLHPNRGVLSKPINILARLEGSEEGKALLVFTHYDSALVPSYGASDAGSGVVTILESLRAFKASGKQPKNDIIILFTDGEETGLDGAKLFVNEHPWAKDVGISLNFEARGSGGPSNMILETNHGNANLIKAFQDANPEYPVATSLMYSIYKMLPNDTDSTVLREDGDLDGFFFAFIDDHYDYHTANDNVERLDRLTAPRVVSAAAAALFRGRPIGSHARRSRPCLFQCSLAQVGALSVFLDPPYAAPRMARFYWIDFLRNTTWYASTVCYRKRFSPFFRQPHRVGLGWVLWMETDLMGLPAL